MAHEFHKAAKESHSKKLKSYGADEKSSSGKAKNFAGFDALNTNDQAGLKIIDKEPSLSEETAPRIMRKAGGAVKGALSLKRLDKAPRKGKQAGGSYINPPPEEVFTKTGPRLKELRTTISPEKGPTKQEVESINRKQRYSIEDLSAPRRASGGKTMHDDEVEDRKLVKKMVKSDALTGKKDGGRAKRGSGGPLAPKAKIYNSSDNNVIKSAKSGVRMGALTEAAKTSNRVKKFSGGGFTDNNAGGKGKGEHLNRGKTSVNIIIGNPNQMGQGMPGGQGMPPQAGEIGRTHV